MAVPGTGDRLTYVWYARSILVTGAGATLVSLSDEQ